MSPLSPHLAAGPLLDHDGDTMGQSQPVWIVEHLMLSPPTPTTRVLLLIVHKSNTRPLTSLQGQVSLHPVSYPLLLNRFRWFVNLV